MIEGTCQMCGEDGRKSPLQQHHINTDWKDDREENKQVLCASCHKKIHLKHGPSVRPHITSLTGDELKKYILKFNKKYIDFGGYEKLEHLCKSSKHTLYDVARHFGKRYDTTAYYWVKRSGLKWTPVVDKYNIYSEPQSSKDFAA